MRIAQVAPLFESVPPQKYGGTERIVSYITEELVRRGHEVTLYASGDSRTSARLVSCAPRGLRMASALDSGDALLFCMLEKVSHDAHTYDVVHYHTDFYHFPVSRRNATVNVTTLHGRLDLPGLPELYDEFGEMPLVSISDAQRQPVPRANWQGTVYHGMPLDDIRFQPDAGDYLVFLSRFSPEKRADRAIEIAQLAEMPLKMLGKVDPADKAYFDSTIRPLLKSKHIEFLGETEEEEKLQILSRARALLFPIDWPEPFGMVLMEAMAAGTPTIAFPFGSVPEVLSDPRSGIVVRDVAEAASAAKRIDRLERAGVRGVFEQRFSVGRMVDDYLGVYERLLNSDGNRRGRGDGRGEWLGAPIVPVDV